MYKIGVIGEQAKVLCYMAAGFAVYFADTPDAARAQIRAAKNDSCRIIYVTSELAPFIDDPGVIPLPEKDSGFACERMSRAVARAVGSDVIYREKR